MSDSVISVAPASVEQIAVPLLLTGVPRAVAETYTVEVAVLLWDATAPLPPTPDGGTTWNAATWDVDADELTVVFRVGPGTPVGTLTNGARYRAYIRVTGGGNAAVEDVGTIVVGSMWSYSGSPLGSDRDRVRFEVGDTAPPWSFTDAEVDYALGANPGRPLAAAADLAEALAFRYAKDYASETDGDLAVSKGERWQRMVDLADRLQARAAAGDEEGLPTDSLFADPELGDDTDRGKPTFVLGGMDNKASW